MTQVFLCPTCGAPLDPGGNSGTVRCPYCNNFVAVPPELIPPTSETPSAAPRLLFDSEKVHKLREMARMVRDGQLIAATTVFRDITGVSEIEARQAVEAMRNAQPVILSHSVFSDSEIQTSQGTFSPPSNAKTTNWLSLLFSWIIGLVIVLSIALPVLGVAYGMIADGPLTPLWQRINPFGFARVVTSFGSEGTGPGYFTDSRSIAVDPKTGRVFVGEYDTGRIQAFDPAGKFLFQWQVQAKPKPYLRGISAGHNGLVYLVLANSPILLFDGATGKPVGTITCCGDRPSFESVFALPDGGVLAIVDDETVVRFNSDGQVVRTIPAAVSSISEDPELTARAAVSGIGDLYILGTFNFSVFHYSPQGKYVSRFGGEGEEPGQLSLGTNAIAIDSQGRVYVADGNAIKVFASDGRYLDAMSFQDAIFDMAFDDANILYVVTNKPDVEKLVIQK
jgi:hypothetical protein